MKFLKIFPESSDRSGQVTNNLPLVRSSHVNLRGISISTGNQKNLQHKVTSDSAHKYNITPPHLLIFCIEIISTSMVVTIAHSCGSCLDGSWRRNINSSKRHILVVSKDLAYTYGSRVQLMLMLSLKSRTRKATDSVILYTSK